MVCHTGENTLLTNVRDAVRDPVGYGTVGGPLRAKPGRYCAADKLQHYPLELRPAHGAPAADASAVKR